MVRSLLLLVQAVQRWLWSKERLVWKALHRKVGGGQDYEEGEAVVMEISGRRGSGSQPSGEMVIDDGMVEVPMDMLANIGSSQEEEYEVYLESIMHLVKSKPENVSALIRTWISEGA